MGLRSLLDVPAPAKLNLFLHCTGRRADGYHLLQSVFVLIDWQDTLHFERRADGRLARHDLGPALPADDLVLRAARLLQARSDCRFGADISIDKQVPWGAGMGGGSSDAATVLLALNRLWGLGWSRADLLALAPELGADVPFFVGGDNALVEGIGERLAPIGVPAQRFVVVKPAASIPTAEIFRHRLMTRDTEPAILQGFLGDTSFGHNDLQAAAEDHCPEVAQVARWLESRFGNSRMTGSGSAVFSRVDAGSTASPSAIDLTDLPDGWVGRECRSLASHPLRDWVG